VKLVRAVLQREFDDILQCDLNPLVSGNRKFFPRLAEHLIDCFSVPNDSSRLSAATVSSSRNRGFTTSASSPARLVSGELPVHKDRESPLGFGAAHHQNLFPSCISKA
jgi:hypothetical protein